LGEGLFQRASYSSERRGLFLSKLIVEKVDAGAMTNEVAGHP
jgi:hypothetical protein